MAQVFEATHNNSCCCEGMNHIGTSEDDIVIINTNNNSRTGSSSSTMDDEFSSTTTTSKSTKSSTSSYSSCHEMGDEIWNNKFVFKFVQPEDYSKVLAHMRESFYRDEPLNAITGYSEEKAQDMDLMITTYFKDGISSIVIDKDTNKVAGARIMAIHRRNVADSPMKINSIEMNKIMPFLGKLDEEAGIFEKYPEIDEYAELFMASVHPEFRGQGLAGEMYRGAIRLLQAKGFTLLKSSFTSPFTQKIGEKMGFRELARARFKDYRDENGEIIFPDARDDESAAVGVLEI